MQLLVGVDGLGALSRYSMNLRHKSTSTSSKVHLPFTNRWKCFIDVLPLDILPVCQSFEIGKEIALHLGLVKAVVLVENGFVTPGCAGSPLFHHACVEITLLLVWQVWRRCKS